MEGEVHSILVTLEQTLIHSVIWIEMEQISDKRENISFFSASFLSDSLVFFYTSVQKVDVNGCE